MLLLLLLLVGLALIFLEFFLPGAVFAVLGSIFLMASLVISFVNYPLSWAFAYLVVVPFAVFGVCKLALLFLEKSKKRGDFASGFDQEGFVASTFDASLIGKEGVVSTELKPAGHIAINGNQYQALSEQGFVEKGSAVQVVSGRGAYLVVHKKR